MAEPAHGAESAVGMPQLDFSTYPNQIFWLVLSVVALYLIISKVAVPRIGGLLNDRHEAISNDLEAAADLKRRAEEAEAAYNKALAEARSEAQRIGAETKAAIQEELKEATAKADAEIAARAAESEARITEIRDSALRSIEEVAADTGAAIVRNLLPDAADDAAVKAAVAAAMKG